MAADELPFVLFVGDYYVRPTAKTVRHCVDCHTNPVMTRSEAGLPSASEDEPPDPMRCRPCDFKRTRRMHAAANAKWDGEYWPDSLPAR